MNDRHATVRLPVPAPRFVTATSVARPGTNPWRMMLQRFIPLRALLWLGLLLLAGPAVVAQDDPDSAPLYDRLAELLENEEARERLIAELRRLAAGEALQEVPPAEETGTFGLPRRIAEMTQSVAEGAARELVAAVDAIRAVDLGRLDARTTLESAAELALVIAATLALFLLLRAAARPIFRRTATHARGHSVVAQILRRGVAVVLATAIDVLVVVLAWLGGQTLALVLLGGSGNLHPDHALFLNAFLLIELSKTVLRALFCARYPDLRLLPLTDEEAAYWNAWLARLVGFTGYGLLFAVPMTDVYLGVELGRTLGLAVMLVAFVYALVIILQNRRRVRDHVEAAAQRSNFAFVRFLWSLLARTWHWIAIVYAAALAVVAILRPEDALAFMVRATLQTAAAILVGAFVAVLLTQIISRRIRVAEETRARYPLLEERLNAYIPTGLKLVRLIIIVAVTAFVADAWELFNLGEWLVSEAGARTVGTAVSVGLILLLATLVWVAVTSWIEHRLAPVAGRRAPGSREKTLLAIFRNVLAITLVVVSGMVILAEIGINIGPLIAGAGVIGLAVGFGAQKLVQDVITGVFIQLDNAINTGDVVSVAGITGVVERLTIRSLGLRDLSGTYHIVPFSSVDSVSNFMRDFAYHVGEYGVAYKEDVDEVFQRLQEAFEELRSQPEHRAAIVGELEVSGVTALADSSVNVRVRIKTLPGMQWGVGRAYNRLVKRHFDAAGIEIPFPHMTLYFGEDKDGTPTAARLALEARENGVAIGSAAEAASFERAHEPEPAAETDSASAPGATSHPAGSRESASAEAGTSTQRKQRRKARTRKRGPHDE